MRLYTGKRPPILRRTSDLVDAPPRYRKTVSNWMRSEGRALRKAARRNGRADALAQAWS